MTLYADLAIPVEAHGIILFAHGSGSSRHSPRNQFVALIHIDRSTALVRL